MNKEYIHKDTKTDEPLQQELQNYFQVINGTALYYENYVKQLEQELERYKNIIDELERYIKTEAKIEIYGDKTGLRTFVDGQDLLDKLKELKGSDR